MSIAYDLLTAAGGMRQVPSMKLTPILLLTFFALFIGCKAEVLDGGSRSQEATDGRPKAPGDPTASSSDSGSSGRGFGEDCTSTAECGGGLECLPFAVHRQDGSCEEVGTTCTRACKGDGDCSGLEGSPKCFRGCGDDLVCGRTSSGTNNAITFTIEDAPEALTSDADDRLFSLTVTKISPTRTYRMVDVEVVVEPVGETGNIVPCTHDDTNADGNLDVGETLHCVEPPVDTYRATHAGKSIAVSLVERIDAGSYTTRGTGTWTPAK